MSEARIVPAPDAPAALVPALNALKDAHEQWHDALESYHEPVQLTRHIHALVQTLRNVTFRLQASNHQVPFDFDSWYADWRDLIVNDERMLWLRDARTEIVKRSGLQPESFAMVKIVDSYLEPKNVLLRVPPNEPTLSVVNRARESIPINYRIHIAIEVRRRWVVPERPREELLTLLVHCFHILDALLLHAAARIAGETVDPPAEFVETVLYPDCMIIDPSEVALQFEADTGAPYTLTRGQGRPAMPPEMAMRRYSAKMMRKLDQLPGDPLERAAVLHEVARSLFKRDGAHIPLLYLRDQEGEWELVVVLPEDKRDKFMIWHHIGQRILVEGHDALIFTSETWMSPNLPDGAMYPDLEHMPGRREALITDAATVDGVIEEWLSVVKRRVRGRPRLMDAEKVDPLDRELGYLSPVVRAWKARERFPGQPTLSREDLRMTESRVRLMHGAIRGSSS